MHALHGPLVARPARVGMCTMDSGTWWVEASYRVDIYACSAWTSGEYRARPARVGMRAMDLCMVGRVHAGMHACTGFKLSFPCFAAQATRS